MNLWNIPFMNYQWVILVIALAVLIISTRQKG